jgi:hypothetical protein
MRRRTGDYVTPAVGANVAVVEDASRAVALSVLGADGVTRVETIDIAPAG